MSFPVFPGRRALLAAMALCATSLALPSSPARAGEMSCTQAQAAPAMKSSDPLYAPAMQLYQRVHTVSRAMTGRSTRLKLIARGVTGPDGKPFSPTAMVCAMRDPTIFVSAEMLELVFVKKLYPPDFLALVLGHELGHRLHDLDDLGNVRPTRLTGNEREARADVRGAYFAAAAGYAMRKVACDDCLNQYLDTAHVSEEFMQQRKAALRTTLRDFDGYEGLFETALALVFWDANKAAWLLEWAARLMIDYYEKIPEFNVLIAIVQLQASAPDAPWKKQLGIRARRQAGTVRCTVLYPEHTSLWQETEGAAGTGKVTRGAAQRLAEAKAKLEEAGELGASELVVQSGLACVHFYNGDAAAARKAIDAARKALPPKAPAAVKSALESNETLVRWLEFLAANKELRGAGWTKKVAGAAKDFKSHAELAETIGRITGKPAKVKKPAKALRCKPAKGIKKGMFPRPPVVPLRPASGGCPCGWSLIHRMSDPTNREYGVSTCLPAGWTVGQRYVEVALPSGQGSATLQPQYTMRMLIMDDLEPGLRAFRTWQDGCGDTIERQGVGDQGSVAWTAACREKMELDGAVVFSDGGCSVTRVVRIE